MRFSVGGLKVDIFKFKDLQTSEVNAKLYRLHRQDWRSFLVMRNFINPFATKAFNTMLNVVWEKKYFSTLGIMNL